MSIAVKKIDFKFIVSAVFMSGGIFGMLYLTGFIYLSFYFTQFGGLVSFTDLSSAQIAILGIIPLFLFSIIVFGVYWFASQVVKITSLNWILSNKYFWTIGSLSLFFLIIMYYYSICLDGQACVSYFPKRIPSLLVFGFLPMTSWKRFLIVLLAMPLLYFLLGPFLFVKYKMKNTTGAVIFTAVVVSVIFYFWAISIYASLVFYSDFTYDFVLNQNSKVPIVQIIYSKPLIDSRKTAEEKKVGDNDYVWVKLKEVREGKVYFKKPDEWFEDALGEKRFIGYFILYFESKDNYYVKPLGDLAMGYSEALFTLSEARKKDGALLKDTVISENELILLLKSVILPKKEVESIKYMDTVF